MKTLSQIRTGIDPPRTATDGVHYVFWGGVIGVLCSLAALLAMSTYYGATSGLGPLGCALFGSVMTVMLSQPIALVGLIAGTACGGTCALVAYYARRWLRSH